MKWLGSHLFGKEYLVFCDPEERTAEKQKDQHVSRENQAVAVRNMQEACLLTNYRNMDIQTRGSRFLKRIALSSIVAEHRVLHTQVGDRCG
jgi:hypothetical protein